MGIQSGHPKEALVLWKNWQNRSSDRYFQEQILGAQFLHLLISRKALNSFMVIPVPSWLAKSSAKTRAWLHILLSSPKSHIYQPSLYLFGAASQSIWNAISRAIVLILPPIKLNSQLFLSTFFKSTLWVYMYPATDISLNGYFKNLHFKKFKYSWLTYILKITAAKLLQLCPTLCDPIDGTPPGFWVPGILQARTLKWVAISFSNAWKWKVNVKSLSCVWPLATPWTAAHQAPPSRGFTRQEYGSGVP